MFKLAWIHMKRYFKNPILLLMMGPIPLALILASMLLGGNNESFDANVAFVLEVTERMKRNFLKIYKLMRNIFIITTKLLH